MRLNDQIESLCVRAIRGRVFPGCTVAWLLNGRSATRAFGRLTYEPDAPAVLAETRYDVASITKSVPTSSLLLKLIEDGRVGLDDLVIKYIPELQNDYRDQILVRHLLTYTVVFDFPGGLAEAAQRDPEHLFEVLFKAPLVAKPGAKYFYTNPPAILMGLIVERVYKKPLDDIAQEVLFGPMGMEATTFDGGAFDPSLVAPSEVVDGRELRGSVHDESARALASSGLVCGAAGVFSTAGDLLRISQMLLNEGEIDGVRVFQPETVEQMHTTQIAGLGESAGLGWELNRPKFMGEAASDQTFGKTGFTGCVMLIDPEKQAALVHLSNRTYPKRAANRDAINAFRRELADLIFAAA